MNKKTTLLIVSLLLGLALASLGVTSASAAPAAPIDHELTQPDGSTFIAHQWGDEWSNGFETDAGYTILQDENDWWVYAQQAPDGTLIPIQTDEESLFVGRSAVPDNIPTHLRPPRIIPDSAIVFQSGDRTPNTGTQPTLVLLASFSNRSETYDAASFASSFFGASNSVRDYYLKASFNQLTIAPAAESHGTSNDGVVGWLNLGYNHPNTGTSTGLANQQIVKNALIAADPFVNYASFDSNGDGKISNNELHIVVVVAGYERAYSSSNPGVWAHRWDLNLAGPPVLDGKTLGDYNYNGGYSQFGEIHSNHQATIGIMIHELGHDITWPDLYDTDGSSDGVGDWSIMGGGSWNTTGGGYYGSSPALPDAFLKYYQGWISPTPVAGTLTGASIPQAATNASAFLLRPNPNGVDWNFNVSSGTGEYFLVENRQLTGYDAGLPGCGLLIWHIDESVTSSNAANANENRPLVKLMEADGLNHLYNGSNSGDAGDPFPGTSNNRTFNYSSTPNSRLYSGADSLVAVTSISNCAATMTANLTYSGVSVPPIPTGVAASDGTYADRVRVSWTASTGATFYEVYRHASNDETGANKLENNPASNLYDDTSALAGQDYYYWVKACNSAGCSTYSASAMGRLGEFSSLIVYLPLISYGGGASTPGGIINGGFEQGALGWTQYSFNGENLIYRDTQYGMPHSGEWFAWLGWAHNETSQLSQTVTISASQPHLHFWLWIESADICGYDFFYIKVNGAYVAYADLCADDNTDGWVKAVWDLSPYKNETINLMFEVTTDSLHQSNLLLDDVSLSSSATATPFNLIPCETPMDAKPDKTEFDPLK